MGDKIEREDNMFVKCNSNNCYRLKKNDTYKIIRETDKEYYIKLSEDVTGIYNKNDFIRIVKEEVMKIKQWSDLENSIINGFAFSVTNYYVNVRSNGDSVMTFYYKTNTNNQIIAHLALLGIEIEFEKEVTITQNDYNWLVAMELEKTVGIMKSGSDNHVWIGGFKAINTKHLFKTLEPNKGYLVSDLLKCRVEG